MREIFVQMIGFIPSVIAITALQSPNRKKILILQFLCSAMWLVHHWMLGASTFVATDMIGLLRALLCYYNDRSWAKAKWIPYGIGALYITGTICTWSGIASLFPCIAMLLTTAALQTHDMRLTRLLYLLNSPFMLIADILTGSYATAAVECVALASFALAVYRFDIRNTRRHGNGSLVGHSDLTA